MNEASLAFPDPTEWIEIPEATARLHKTNMKPCTECNSWLWDIILIKRPAGTNEDGSINWSTDVSVECPRCKLSSTRRTDRRERIARLDKVRKIVIDITKGYEK